MDRREFIKTIGVAGGAMLVGRAAGASVRNEAEVRRESSADPLLAGVCDIHIHCLPDTRARCIDELALAGEAKRAGIPGADVQIQRLELSRPRLADPAGPAGI